MEQVESRENATGRGPKTPARLHDDVGKAILPVQHLPGVDFGAHLSEEEDMIDAGKKGAEAREDVGSYFPEQSIGKTNSGPEIGQETPDEAVMKRVMSAPIEGSRRPKPLKRSSTFLQALKSNDKEDQMPFNFDPMSSESELSSSDEEEKPTRRPKQPKRAQTTLEKQEQQHRRQEAKRGYSYSRFRVGNDQFRTKGRVSRRDGRLNISINETANTGYLAKALGQTIKHHLDVPNQKRDRKKRQHAADHPAVDVDADAESIASSLHTSVIRPRLNIVIMVIGSRGDIQPFLKIGKILHHDYGHRVRIATHPTFRDFVEKETDLEFFSVGGDPSELMAFMVKNPGLMPSLQTIREGEIHRRRAAMSEMFDGMWRACTSSTDGENDPKNSRTLEDKFPFIADAIIANPPSMAHVHIAEKLGIPLHIMFTFPYSPTQAFPHPLANIKPGKSNVDANYVNFMSYPLVEMMTWQGLGDIVNKFRKRTLGLEPVSSLWAPGALYRMKVPYTYMWSPSLVAKPNDWGQEIDIAGFVFMELASNFEPPQDLIDFLNAGEPPIYIGFGSIVIDDPDGMTDLIMEAVKLAGVRALVNKGWGGLGATNDNTPDNVFMLGNTPHDWLFPKCKAVVHHGGAGTTAIGLKCAKPTMIVPFFGDQPFWAARVAEAKAGAHEVVPWRRLTAEKFAEGIKQCLTEEAQRNVQKLADGIAKEGDGAMNACKSFHRSLPLAGKYNMRCSILEDRVAKWSLKGSSLRLSALAADILVKKGKIKPHDLKLFRVYSWNDFDGPGEPISGTIGAVTDSLTGISGGVGMVPVRVAKHMKQRAEHDRKKLERQRRKEKKQMEKNRIGLSGQQDGTASRPAAKRENTTNTLGSALSADPTTPLAKELARDFGEGFKKSGAALLTMPNDLHVAIAQGFHNAPRLWGDATVRKPVRITGFKSGCEAAGKEFSYGIYDAWTGLVMQPVNEVKDGDTVTDKIVGCGMGVGKGLGGFVLKNVSALVSPPAYLGKGMIVYIKKKAEANGPGSKHDIKKAIQQQGTDDYTALNKDGKNTDQLKEVNQKVEEGWKVYSDIWTAAHHNYNDVGKNVVGKYKLKREKKRWIDAGAMENVHTAHKALRVQTQGDDLEEHFAKRQQEMEVAEQPRAPAMEQPGQFEENLDVLPNGRKVQDAAAEFPSPEKADESEKHGLESDEEGTAVGSSEDGEKDAFDAGGPLSLHPAHRREKRMIDEHALDGQVARGGGTAVAAA